MARSAHEHRPGASGWQRALGAALLLVFASFPMAAADGSTNTVLPKADKARSAYVFLAGEDGTAAISASETDLTQARELRSHAGEELLWVRRDGRVWVVRDSNLLAEVHKLLDPQLAIGTRQGSAGAKQGGIAAQQVELGQRQVEVRRQKDALKAEISKQTKSGQKVDELKVQLRSLEEKEKDLGRQQAELGQQQVALGQQQAQMGGEQGKNAEKSYKELGTIVDRAIHQGLAQEVKR